MFTIEELKRKTKENGLTYADLSEASGVSQNSINQIFRGRVPDPRYSTVCAIMRALGLDNELSADSSPRYARVYESLTEINQARALGFMEGLLSMQNSER